MEYLDYSFRNDSLNDITLNDEYNIAIKFLHEKKNDSKKNSSYEKYKKENKDFKKRINGGDALGILKKFYKSPNETNNISNMTNHSSFKPKSYLKTTSNNSSKTKSNKNIYFNSCNNSFNKMKLSNCPSSGIQKTKINLIKIEKKI